ncbi:MAG: type II toxin-antitoxin system Phd/YefM family antitoxin [Pseudonocardia sp.]|nr:type II toxin-antitoxin system Phd/YefM family antitoxin [Pseudonocardia sp.]
MVMVGVHEAKTQLSKLLQQVEAGEDVVVTRGGEPIARLVPFRGLTPRPLGLAAGEIWIADDFDELPEEILAEFER